MGRLRRQKRLLGWIAAVALLGNVLATALIVRTAAALTILEDMLGPITLCTAAPDRQTSHLPTIAPPA